MLRLRFAQSALVGAALAMVLTAVPVEAEAGAPPPGRRTGLKKAKKRKAATRVAPKVKKRAPSVRTTPRTKGPKPHDIKRPIKRLGDQGVRKAPTRAPVKRTVGKRGFKANPAKNPKKKLGRKVKPKPSVGTRPGVKGPKRAHDKFKPLRRK